MTLDAAGTGGADIEHDVQALDDLLQPYAGTVSFDRDRSIYGATFSIGEPNLDPAAALSCASILFNNLTATAGLPAWPIVHAEITRVSDHTNLKLVR